MTVWPIGDETVWPIGEEPWEKAVDLHNTGCQENTQLAFTDGNFSILKHYVENTV